MGVIIGGRRRVAFGSFNGGFGEKDETEKVS